MICKMFGHRWRHVFLHAAVVRFCIRCKAVR